MSPGGAGTTMGEVDAKISNKARSTSSKIKQLSNSGY
jgi:hypothetical protein